MIRAALLACLLAGCAAMPLSCPEPMVSAFICPEPMHDFYDHDFRDELTNELQLAPEDLALAKAARAYLSQVSKCEQTF